MPEPIENPTTPKKFVSSTARILVGLVESHLNLGSVPADSPLKNPIKKYTVLNCKTAQIRNELLQLPQVSITRDRVEAALAKLKSIASDPTEKGINAQAKANYDIFAPQFKIPADNITTELAAVENLKTEFKNLVGTEHDAILKIIDQIKTAPSPKTASEAPQVRDIFSALDKQRVKIVNSLTSVAKNLKSQLGQLNSLFPQVYNSIPATKRKDIPTADDRPHQALE